MTTYRTVDGDMIDAIAKAQLGAESHAPAILAINPGLGDLGPVYDAGVIITLPVVSAPVTTGQIRLWGRT